MALAVDSSYRYEKKFYVRIFVGIIFLFSYCTLYIYFVTLKEEKKGHIALSLREGNKKQYYNATLICFS